MLKRTLLVTLALTTFIWSETNDTNFKNISLFPSKILQTVRDINRSILQNEFNGNWHIRMMDGKDVRQARAILDLDLDDMKLSGFDACNQMHGALVKHSEDNISVPTLMTTRMGCREAIHLWVSVRLHQLLKEGFSIKEEEKYGVEGVTIKSPHHELFLKKMGED